MKFCLPALHFLIGRTEGKNGSFIAIRMRIHQNFSSSMTSLGWKLKNQKKNRPEAMPKFLIVMCICGIFATVTVLWGTRWVTWCI